MIYNYLFPLAILACSQDVSIMKIPEKEQDSASQQDTLDTDIDTDQDTDSSDTDSQDVSDLTVAFAEIHFRQVACQACLGVSQEIQITAELKQHLPTSADYVSHLPSPGSCTTNIYETYVSSQGLPATQPAYFNSIPLYPSGDGTWINSSIAEHEYSRNTSHTISGENGTVANAFTSIEGFDDIQPYTLLWVDPSYAYEAVISKSGTTFTWAPVVPNSQFEIIVAVYSSDGSTFLGAVSCMEDDAGYMVIPGSYIQPYPAYSITAVHLIRHRIELIESQDLGGVVQSHMMWEVIGTGHVE